jgi:hypothetical protein
MSKETSIEMPKINLLTEVGEEIFEEVLVFDLDCIDVLITIRMTDKEEVFDVLKEFYRNNSKDQNEQILTRLR